MGIASFETECELIEYERWLAEIEQEEPIENDPNYDAWCEEQIKVSKMLQKDELRRHLTKIELLPERAN